MPRILDLIRETTKRARKRVISSLKEEHGWGKQASWQEPSPLQQDQKMGEQASVLTLAIQTLLQTNLVRV